MSTVGEPFRWRSIALPALLPTILFSIGEGAIIPIIPTVADDLGATLAIAGLVAAVLTIGELLGNIPSGWLIARIGERPAMIGATSLSVVGLVICLIAPTRSRSASASSSWGCRRPSSRSRGMPS